MTQRLTLPEIDRLVAERVMGWITYRHSAIQSGYGGDVEFWEKPGVSVIHKGDWRPTANIANAWQVVERVTDPRTLGDCGFPVATHFRHWWRGSDLCRDTAADAALKISLAALSAVGVEVEAADG